MSDLIWLKYEIILHWIAVAIYIVATVLYTHNVFFGKGAHSGRAMFVLAAGLVPHTAALLIRWIQQGHGPYMTRYEVLSSDAWIVLVMFLLFGLKWERIRAAGMAVVPVAFLLIAVGLFSNPEMKELPPTLRSVWLVMHVTFAKLAAGAIILALGAAVLYMIREKYPAQQLPARIPSSEILDDYSYKFAGFGFIFWTINIAAGAIWANVSWGRYWGWDPIETWSLITWLMFGIFAHLRVFWKWRGIKSAAMLIACFLMSMFTLFILPFVGKSLHSEYFTP